MSHAKNKVRWCLNKAEKEGVRHRGLAKIKPSIEKARNHVEKAEHNLRVTLHLKSGGYTDWCSSSLFYAIYHCFLSILVKHGFESRNQDCTFAVINLLIEEEKIDFSPEHLEKILDLNNGDDIDTIVGIREKYQYSTEISMEDDAYEDLMDLAKEILNKTKEILSD